MIFFCCSAFRTCPWIGTFFGFFCFFFSECPARCGIPPRTSRSLQGTGQDTGNLGSKHYNVRTNKRTNTSQCPNELSIHLTRCLARRYSLSRLGWNVRILFQNSKQKEGKEKEKIQRQETFELWALSFELWKSFRIVNPNGIGCTRYGVARLTTKIRFMRIFENNSNCSIRFPILQTIHFWIFPGFQNFFTNPTLCSGENPTQ